MSFIITRPPEGIILDVDSNKYVNQEGYTHPAKLLEHMNGLQTAINTYENSAKVDADMRHLFSYVYDRLEMIHFASEMSKELNSENSRKDFEQDKNRLITLMAKNHNIYSKLNNQKINFYIFLGMLVLYTVVMMFVYAQSGMLEKHMQFMILIGLALTVLIVFGIVDLYQMVTSQHYEGFDAHMESGAVWDDVKNQRWDTVSESFNTEMQDIIDTLVLRLPHIVKYSNLLRNDETNKTKQEVISNILNDFNNQNYVNMRRYQLTDYKINETRNKMHFVKYGFLLVSVIALLAGLHLRTEMGPESNYLPVSKTVLMSMASLLAITFFFVYFMHQKQNMMRKKYNWNKLYWNVRATHRNQGDYMYMP